MKINEVINTAQNVKAESGMKELQSVAATLSDPENWAVSMTGEPKLGINPQVGISEDTPKGIYFYPLDYAVDIARRGKKLPWGDNMPYIQLFQYDRSGEMTKKTKVDPARLKQALLQYCPEEVIQQAAEENEYDGTPYWFIYDCLSRLGKGDETNVVRWNKVLRDLGFTSVYDDGAGWIAHNEPTQGVVLDPRIIKQLKTILNKKKSGVVTPAVIERDIFNTLDIELASDRAWQAYDPDGSKLKAAAKELAKRPEFKQWFGKPGSEEIFDKAASLGRYGAVQLRREAWDWDKEQQAQQPVTEAFDQPYKLKWETSDYSSDVDALAKMDDGGYLSIMFNKGYNQATKEEAWSVEFYRNNSQEVTGEGDQQRVFATVLSAIQQFIKKYKPNNVIFAASKQVEAGQNSASRARLYDRLVQRYATSWGFRMTRDDTGNKVIYDLSRITPIVAKAVAEGFANAMSVDNMIAYLRQHHDENLHPDYLNHLTTTNSKFVLKNIPLTSIRTELAGLDRAKVEQYKKMDFSKAPPIVVGSDGNILDGYHRATVAKALGISAIKAYVGVKGQQAVAEHKSAAMR